MEIVLWLACGVTTIIAAVLASRSRRWRYIGRAAVGALFVLGGALVNASYLASGGTTPASPTLRTSPG